MRAREVAILGHYITFSSRTKDLKIWQALEDRDRKRKLRSQRLGLMKEEMKIVGVWEKDRSLL